MVIGEKKYMALKRHVLDLADDDDCGIFAPPMDYCKMCFELIHFFLGEDWYTANPVGARQVATEALLAIEAEYAHKANRKYVRKIFKNDKICSRKGREPWDEQSL